ncbi:hypothetical protein J6590_008438 [Homalodisca vitripennis]|nr:hypothetical protein J6590_008438 [Homalodisca vitripennis]
MKDLCPTQVVAPSRQERRDWLEYSNSVRVILADKYQHFESPSHSKLLDIYQHFVKKSVSPVAIYTRHDCDTREVTTRRDKRYNREVGTKYDTQSKFRDKVFEWIHCRVNNKMNAVD